MTLCGHVVGNNPDGAADINGKLARDIRTREGLECHFYGEYDTEIWDMVERAERVPPNGDLAERAGRVPPNINMAERAERVPPNGNMFERAGRAPPNGDNMVEMAGRVPPNDPPVEDRIIIIIRDMAGERTFFSLRRSTVLREEFTKYCVRKGVDREHMRFLMNGNRIKDSLTPAAYDMQDQEVIHAILEERGY
ncbi:hypothetical protein ACHAWO_006649 [Cyclotella atomus]|uniref:Ubiquitin-like domain-containing protein n=1 Tax=Cyclotella atomus TaxID=382360 RepID=A0ABD3Q9Q3_9STRA